MAKAGKRVKRQIRKNKKKPTAQVVKKKMNMREIMLEKMKMGMLVPQQQMTPQQERQYNALQNSQNQINVLEKGLSELKTKNDALENEIKQKKEEKKNEQDRSHELRQQSQNTKIELKDRERQFKEDEKNAAEKRRLELDAAHLDAMNDIDGQYQQNLKMVQENHEKRLEGEMINYSINVMKGEMEKDKYYVESQKLTDELNKLKIEQDEMKKQFVKFKTTNWLKNYKHQLRIIENNKSKLELAQIQSEEAKKTSIELARAEALNEYWNGTEQDRQTEGFISDGARVNMAIQKALIDEENKRRKIRTDNASVFAKQEMQEKLIEDLKRSQAETHEAYIENIKLNAGIDENRFDTNGKIILTKDEMKIYKDEAKAKADLELTKMKRDSVNAKIALCKEEAKEQALIDAYEDDNHIKSVTNIQNNIERMKINIDEAEKRQTLLNQSIQAKEIKIANDARTKIINDRLNRLDENPVTFDDVIEENAAMVKHTKIYNKENYRLINNLMPTMNIINKNGDEQRELLNTLNKSSNEWDMEDIENWASNTNKRLESLTTCLYNNSKYKILPVDELLKD